MSGQDVLLATKLHVPRPRPGFVPRTRLVGALGEGLARGRVLVCAPAGFGKTALLADWARGGGQPVAWLGLDDGDSDPARFWRYAAAALDRARPGLAGRVGPLLGPPSPTSFEGLVTALINDLAADPGPDEVLLVLDDYHLVDSGPVHESVAFLLENLPPGLRVVVSGLPQAVALQAQEQVQRPIDPVSTHAAEGTKAATRTNAAPVAGGQTAARHQTTSRPPDTPQTRLILER
jgi:LuxR family maltose regulon positive regulatory protein